MKVRLTSISIHQTALAIATIYAVLAFVISLIMCPVFLLAPHPENMPGAFLGIAALMIPLFLPIVYFIFAYIMFAISAWIYNLTAKWTGGVEWTLTTVHTTPSAAQIVTPTP